MNGHAASRNGYCGSTGPGSRATRRPLGGLALALHEAGASAATTPNRITTVLHQVIRRQAAKAAGARWVKASGVASGEGGKGRGEHCLGKGFDGRSKAVGGAGVTARPNCQLVNFVRLSGRVNRG